MDTLKDFVLAIVLAIANVLLKGWMMLLAFTWFAYPIWGDLGLTLANCIGLSFAYSLICNEYKKDTESGLDYMAKVILIDLARLGICYTIYLIIY